MDLNTQAYDALIIGASGGIGQAMAEQLIGSDQIAQLHMSHRHKTLHSSLNGSQSSKPVHSYHLDISDTSSISRFIEQLRSTKPTLRLIINTAGILHGNDFKPERRLADIQIQAMQQVMLANCIGHAAMISALSPLLPRQGPVILASLSARVGSISDNRLGGWYSYRASKAALNQIIKTASIELRRYNKDSICLALHPGTVATNLSAPFQKGVPEHQLFDTQLAAQRLLSVIASKTPKDSGLLFDWNNQQVPF